MLTKSFVRILSVLMLVGLIAACSSGEDRQEKYLERAQAYFEEGDIDKARIEARNVLQINPKNTAARQLLGEISYDDGDIRKAYGMFLSVLDENPDNIAAHTSMAKIYIAVKDYDKTIEHSNSILAIESDNALVLGYKALALAGQGNIAKAEEVAAEALLLDPGSTEALGVLLTLGSACLAAFAQVFVKGMAGKESTTAIVFWFSATSTLLSLVTIPFGWVWPNGYELTLLIGAGIVGGLGQVLLTSSYRFAEAGVLAPFTYVSILWSVLIGYVWFSEVPTLGMLVGAALVICAGVIIVLRERALGMDATARRKVKAKGLQ